MLAEFFITGRLTEEVRLTLSIAGSKQQTFYQFTSEAGLHIDLHDAEERRESAVLRITSSIRP